MSGQVWIALVEVTPQQANVMFGGAPGAYANVLTQAVSYDDYRQKIESALRDERLDVRSVKDAEPLDERRTNFQVPAEIIALADRAAHSVVWDTFYVFESET